MSNKLREIEALGQSIWIDNLNRDLLDDGTMARLVEEDGIRTPEYPLALWRMMCALSLERMGDKANRTSEPLIETVRTVFSEAQEIIATLTGGQSTR